MRRLVVLQGEHKVADRPGVIITTLLGSCVAVCLRDSIARVGGMNHFLLAEPGNAAIVDPADLQRYGIHAMELLINALMNIGAARSRLRAQVYGGANVVPGLGRIGSSNALFARRFLETEGISISHCDIGGTSGRRLDFLPYEGKARCRAVDEPVALSSVRPDAGGGDIEIF
jgi:chemotaxis protein CheD